MGGNPLEYDHYGRESAGILPLWEGIHWNMTILGGIHWNMTIMGGNPLEYDHYGRESTGI